MRWLADLLYLLAGLAYTPVALYDAIVRGKNRRGWAERFGFVRRFDLARPRIWIHAVSLGEINATPRLVDQLHQKLPGHEIVVSTTTDTGFARAVQLYGREHVFRFPLDFSSVISRVLRRVQPRLIVLVELEVWFNHVRLAAARGIPVAVVNGRLTERSARRLAWLGRPGRSMFVRLAWVGAQDETIAERFRRLGVPAERIEVTSSLKWDSAVVADRVDGADALAAAMAINPSRALWVCGSTGPGEEKLVLDAYARLREPGRPLLRSGRGPASLHDASARMNGPSETTAALAQGMLADSVDKGGDAPVQLAIVPRKPERFDEVARLIQRAGYRCLRRSEHPDRVVGDAQSAAARADASRPNEPTVLLGDTMGELRRFYSLATVVFVGRSLVPLGGSDPMEVAGLGKPIVVGPHMDNFRLPVSALQAADAIRVVDSADSLAEAVGSLLADESSRRALGTRAREVVRRHQGATQRTVDALARLVSPG